MTEGTASSAAASGTTCTSPDDIYVSPSQIKRFDLRTGDTIVGQVRAPKEVGTLPRVAQGRIDQLRGPRPPKPRRIAFDNLKPALSRPTHPPRKRKNSDLNMRVVDIIAPIGKGQRGLIVAPPHAGKTILLQKMANAIAENHPEVHADRAADRRAARGGHRHSGNVPAPRSCSSTFDEPADRHVQVADMVIEKARRLVETGKDVVILLDSITRLARAHNASMPHSGQASSRAASTPTRCRNPSTSLAPRARSRTAAR